jgi:hypothetical protein
METEMVSVKFLVQLELNLEDPGGKLAKRIFREGEFAEIPKKIALRLFRERRILPGLQFSEGGFVEKIYE